MEPNSTMLVQLRRTNNEKPWGFTLVGGIDQRMPVHVQKVSKNSIAWKAGLAPGDVVFFVNRTNITSFTHNAVKAEILRAGNELDFTVKKGAINVQQLAESSPKVSPRVEIVNEHAVRSQEGGSVYRDVETKTFKMLKQQLPESEAGGAAPSSLWDRSMDDRSDYLKATGPTYQKAYGEK